MGTVENVIIQNTTTKINEKAFSNNTNLKQVAIPSSVTTIDKKAFDGSTGFKIYTTKSSTADTFGKNNSIEVIYKAEYPTDFMDSNPGLESKPNVGEATTSTTSDDTTASNTSNDETSGSTETETEEESSSSSQYVHPLDVPEDDSVIGKTVIVNGKAVVLSNNRDEKVYDGE
jgi:hypothetical protein